MHPNDKYIPRMVEYMYVGKQYMYVGKQNISLRLGGLPLRRRFRAWFLSAIDH